MDFTQILKDIITILAGLFDIVGVVLVAVGGTVATIHLVKNEFITSSHQKKYLFDELRIKFGQKMILGLEFFLAGDIMRIIITPTWDGIGRLAAIVIIRTILSYFLHKEIHK